MPELPTLIILAECEAPPTAELAMERMLATPTPHNDRVALLHRTIRKARASGLQVRLVAPPSLALHAQHVLAHEHVIQMADPDEATASAGNDQLAQGVAAAVSASAQSPGWLLLPGDMPLLHTDTLMAMRDAMALHPVVFPEYRQRRGHPIGFSSEFYSELIRLQSERDLQRLLAKYPAHGVTVDDAGILMAQETHSSLALLRTVLQGHTSVSAYR